MSLFGATFAVQVRMQTTMAFGDGVVGNNVGGRGRGAVSSGRWTKNMAMVGSMPEIRDRRAIYGA